MANKVIYQPVAGRLRIDNRDYPLSDLVMDYIESNQSVYLVTIESKISGTLVTNVALSEIEDNLGGTYANIAAWIAWWEALDFGPGVTASVTGGATEAKQDTLIAKDFATQTTLAAVLAKLTSDPATQTTLAAILAKIIAAPATSAKQDTIIADLADLETDVEAVKTAVDNLKTEQFPEAIYILAGTGAATTGTYLGFYAIEADTAISSISGIDTDLVKGDNDFSEVTFQPGTFVRVPGGFTTMTLSAGAMVLVIDNS